MESGKARQPNVYGHLIYTTPLEINFDLLVTAEKTVEDDTAEYLMEDYFLIDQSHGDSTLPVDLEPDVPQIRYSSPLQNNDAIFNALVDTTDAVPSIGISNVFAVGHLDQTHGIDLDIPYEERSNFVTQGNGKKTRFTKKDKEVFFEVFRSNPYPSKVQLEFMARKTNSTVKQVRNWFSNTRARSSPSGEYRNYHFNRALISISHIFRVSTHPQKLGVTKRKSWGARRIGCRQQIPRFSTQR